MESADAHSNGSEIHAIFIQKKLRSAHNENKENKEGKDMSATETKKATAATSEAIAELFHEAMRSYEQALTAGIQLQEESVNLWKDLLSKLGSPEEFQTKLESMRADAFPQARNCTEEFVETFNRMSNQTIDLFAKTLGVYMDVNFVWRLDEMPCNGTIVVVAHGSQPLRWSYLPDGATRLDVESAFARGCRWYKSVDCQATIMKDMKTIDHWRFTVLPAALRDRARGSQRMAATH